MYIHVYIYILFRWKFVVHGGIDGYSRMPTFLRVSTNNKADTVLQAFQQAESEYGLPSRVRFDQGDLSSVLLFSKCKHLFKPLYIFVLMCN